MKHGAGRMYHAGDCDWLQLKSKNQHYVSESVQFGKNMSLEQVAWKKKLNEGMKFD